MLTTQIQNIAPRASHVTSHSQESWTRSSACGSVTRQMAPIPAGGRVAARRLRAESGVQKGKDCGPLATVTSDSDKISRKIRDSVLYLGQAEAFKQ